LSSTSYTSTTRPLDALAASIVVVLCLSWGFNQVATKLAIHDIPPVTQAAVRSAVAALLISAYCRLRGIRLFKRDGTLWFGIAAGILFAAEFILIFQGLLYTTASRATLFIYLAPFFVVLGARIVLPADRFKPAQWLGLSLSFIGMVIAFGVPTPATDPRQLIGDVMMVGAATFLAEARVSGLALIVMLYQLVVSAPVMAIAAILLGERIAHVPSAVAIGSMAYQTVWVVSVTFVIWFALIARYSASRLSAFTFLTPLFGVAAGHLVLGDPLTPAFAAAVALVAAGLMLVNRA
jgi:drug/metabolite transporter (DMT)-like permease